MIKKIKLKHIAPFLLLAWLWIPFYLAKDVVDIRAEWWGLPFFLTAIIGFVLSVLATTYAYVEDV